MTPETTTTTYAAAVAQWDRVRAERDVVRQTYEREHARLTAELREAEQVMGLAEHHGEDVAAAYIVARDLLRVEWAPPRREGARRVATPEVTSCFTDAIEDLRRGAPRLRLRYFGVKAYDRWPSQRHDSEYGFGPSHGHVWMRIGLRHPHRGLTEQERLACIRWLHAVQDDPDGCLR